MKGRDTIILHLRPLASEVPEATRLRHVLKRLLRIHRLKCVDVRVVERAAACEPKQTKGKHD